MGPIVWASEIAAGEAAATGSGLFRHGAKAATLVPGQTPQVVCKEQKEGDILIAVDRLTRTQCRNMHRLTFLSGDHWRLVRRPGLDADPCSSKFSA